MRGDVTIKNLANAITSTRFLFAVGMVLTAPFSVAFWICYLCGGISDLLDGALSRRLKTQSAAGAKLDSAADMFFAAAIMAFAVRYLQFSAWMWIDAACIAALRLVSYSIGFVKYHTFSALHTYANKATGTLIFTFPINICGAGPDRLGCHPVRCGAVFVDRGTRDYHKRPHAEP